MGEAALLEPEVIEEKKSSFKKITQFAEQLHNLSKANRFTFKHFGFRPITKVIDHMDTPEKKEPAVPNLKPLFSLKDNGAFRPANLVFIGLIIALVVAGTLLFFFIRESGLRQQTVTKLTEVESKRVNLEQSVTQLRSDMEKQRGELDKLANELKAANTKAAMVDTLTEEHKIEISRLTKYYENQMMTFKKVIEDRDSLVSTLQTNLEAIRRLLGDNAGVASSSFISTPIPTAKNEMKGSVAAKKSVLPSGELPVGRVMSVNPVHRFIIFNLGPADGIEIGQTIQIYHQGQYLGPARVERVYESLSAATVLSDDLIKHVQTGDQVSLMLA